MEDQISREMRPARLVAPGRILRRELEARGWTQKDLAGVIRRPEQMISEIINGAKQITPETSIELSEAFGTSPEFWYNLETQYRLELARRLTKGNDIARRSQLFSLLPVRDMVRRGWIDCRLADQALESCVLRFLGTASLDEMPEQAARFRCWQHRTPSALVQIAWVRRVEQLARHQGVEEFDPGKLTEAVYELRQLTGHVEDVRRVPEMLAMFGIRLVFLPVLPRTYIDGAAFYLREGPTVALSLRYDRVDAFWFTLMHELAHIEKGREAAYLDDLSEHEKETGREERRESDLCETEELLANREANGWLLDPKAFEEFVASTAPYFSRAKVEHFASQMGVHPGIVVGRLHREGVLPYTHLRSMLEKVSPCLGAYIAS